MEGLGATEIFPKATALVIWYQRNHGVEVAFISSQDAPVSCCFFNERQYLLAKKSHQYV